MVITLVLSGVCFGIKVSPGVFTVTNVPLGPDQLIEVELKVHNTSEDTTDYTITVTQPARDAVLEGYSPIPNVDFFVIEGEKEFKVPPKSVESRKMYCNVPDNAVYHNQRWEVNVTVSGGSAMFRTAVATRYFIETKAKYTDVSPAGEIAIVPSVIIVSHDALESTFHLINTTEKAVEFVLTPFVPDDNLEKIVIQAYGNSPFSKDLVSKLDVQPGKIELEPGATGEIVVKCTKELDSSCEALVKISSGEYKRFVRVLFEAGE